MPHYSLVRTVSDTALNRQEKALALAGNAPAGDAGEGIHAGEILGQSGLGERKFEGFGVLSPLNLLKK